MKKKMKMSLIWLIILGILGYIIGVAIAYFTQEEGFEFVDALSNTIAFAGLGIGAFGGLCLGLTTKTKKNVTGNNTGTTASGQETDINFDSKFITEEKLKTDKEQYIIIVQADTSGDGQVNIMDLMQAKRHVLKSKLLTGNSLLAADLTGDNNVNIMDIMRMIKMIIS